MTVREINDKIRESQIHIRELEDIKKHSLNPREDHAHINKMIEDRENQIKKLIEDREELIERLNHRGIPNCPQCGTKLMKRLFMRRDPDGFYCPSCKAVFDDYLHKTGYVL